MASYNNRSLFSDYYLEELVGEDSHWQTLKCKAWEFRQRITNILEKAVPGINGDTPEAEVERRLIRPILDVLGHVYFVQPTVHSPEGIRRPDYAFFSSPEVRQEAESHKGQPEFFRNALAIGDAKAWERSLDKRVKGPGDPFTNHNPSYQIDFYVRATDKRWGLLTNGRHWRLYHRDLSYRLDVYYEVDLPQIITLDEDVFLYFLAFFHKEAFQADGTGYCFLDRAYRASTEYAAKVSEELKDNIYEALRLLAEGFLSFPANNLKPENLDLVRENAFIVIYRLLFTLYAEAREFLPVTNPTYWGTYSLRALTHEIATKEPFESKLSPTTTMYWSRLRELFNLINSGDDFLHIPPYNGRLFDDQKEHQSLVAWKIGDSYLAEAIDQLARARAAGRTGRGFVSYRDLSIRELGSIYEGLLEHRPRYATQDMAVVKEDKREKFIPLAELRSRKALKVYTAGSVYLKTDKGERKATGSYYTPDYIVKYIVGSTVGPLLDEAKNSDGNLIDSILSLKVLDPAMGSGHFLVEAIDFLARALVEALGGDPREMEEDEVRWARREVVERCIYGVDLNPLAVDLAKLSLWLSTVSLDKPLNFLDHHLRFGNSLIGAKLEDIGLLPEIRKKSKATAVTTLVGHQFKSAIASAVSTFHKIAEAPSDSVEDIHRKEGAYETARYALSRIKSIADVWISVYFGNEVKDKDAYERLLSLAEQDGTEWPTPRELTWLDKAKSIAEERHFFHWELEFPELFFDRNGQTLRNPGFHAVVGNPPYYSCLRISREELSLFLAKYGKLWASRNDISYYFYTEFFNILRDKGIISLIFPRYYLSSDYAREFRDFLVKQGKLLVLADTGNCQVFPDANILTTVLTTQKEATGKHDLRYLVCTALPNKLSVVGEHRIEQSKLYGRMWNLQELLHQPILEKIESVSLPLGNIVEIGKGMSTGCNQAFEIDPGLVEQFKDKSYLRNLIKNGDIRKYFVRQTRKKVVYLEDIDQIEKYPDYFSHLLVYESQLFQRRNYEGPWFKYSTPRNKELWDRRVPKIVVPFMATENRFAVETKRVISTSGDVNVLLLKPSKQYSLYFLCGLLNSKLLEFVHRNKTKLKRAGYMEYVTKQLAKLPIRKIAFNNENSQVKNLERKLITIYEQELSKCQNWDATLETVEALLVDKTTNTHPVHDFIGHLAEQITLLKEQWQQEYEDFLNWLSRELGITIDQLEGKVAIKEYCGLRFEAFLSLLKHSKVGLSTELRKRDFQRTLEKEFERSANKIKNLSGQADRTANLVDQIVYKLYGLSEEEIAVVEGQD